MHAAVDRYTRAEHSQSKQTIQQLLSELMLLRDAMSRSQGSNTAGGRSGTCGNNPPGIAVNGSGNSSRGGGGTDGGAGSPTASSLTSSKQMSKGKLVSELQQLQVRYAEEAARRKEAEAEKVGTECCGLGSEVSGWELHHGAVGCHRCWDCDALWVLCTAASSWLAQLWWSPAVPKLATSAAGSMLVAIWPTAVVARGILGKCSAENVAAFSVMADTNLHHVYPTDKRAVLCCAVLCCAVLCCAVLCCAVLCCRSVLRSARR